MAEEERLKKSREEDIFRPAPETYTMKFADDLRTGQRDLGRLPTMEEVYEEGRIPPPPAMVFYVGERAKSNWIYAIISNGPSGTDRVTVYDINGSPQGNFTAALMDKSNPSALVGVLRHERNISKRKIAIERTIEAMKKELK
ncbi:MAG: hypothetical protein IT381_28140 [Deltaproteobacteria bacterium]|nr:hypothetical protein [Deltaproteobacteria bacterium]